MATTGIWVFETYEAADEARDALLQTGMPAEAVRFTTRQEEAGPVEGNFMLPPEDTEKRGHRKSGFFHSLFHDSDEYTESYNHGTNITQRGSFLIEVDAGDAEQMSAAAAILNRCGGVNAEERRPH